MRSLALLSVVVLLGCSPAAPEPSAPPATSAPSAAPPPAASSTVATPERTDRGWAKAAAGCGDFSVQVSHASKRQFLAIESSRKALGLKKVGDRKTVDVADATRPVSLQVAVYSAPGGDALYCTDVVPSHPVTQTASLSAASGTVTVTLSAWKSDQDFAVDITLTGIKVHNQGGLEAVPDATYADVHVGWLPG